MARKDQKWFKIRRGLPMPNGVLRCTCAKCGEKLPKPKYTCETLDGYCGECKYMLRLRKSTPCSLVHRGLPAHGDWKIRLKLEPAYFFAKDVSRWYNVSSEPSATWKKLQEKYAR